jgi:hypothetical protein
MVNVTEQVAVLFDASLTEKRIFVVPTPTRVPGEGDCWMVTAEQPSIASTWPVKSGTVAWQEAFATTLVFGPQDKMAGGSVSRILRVATTLVLDPTMLLRTAK